MDKEIIVINAIWCPSCLIVKKYLKRLKDGNPNLNIKTFDYDFDAEEVEKYSVGKILPVLILNQNNQEIDRLIGEKTYEEIVEFLEKSDFI